MTITHAVHETIGLTFDFDETLAPSSVDALLEVLEIDRQEWTARWFEPLMRDAWDDILATGYGLIEAAKERGRVIDREVIRESARRLKPYPGVMEMFDRLRTAADQECPGVKLDFTILSSGFADLIVETELAKRFDRVWGSAFYEDERGVAVFVKRTITHPEKALYLAALVKSLGIGGANAPEGTTRHVDEAKMRYPVDQLIYVGDGASDVEAFAYVEERGGLAIAVDKAAKVAGKFVDDQKVENLAPPDFSGDGEMMRSLILGVRSAAARVALRRMARGE